MSINKTRSVRRSTVLLTALLVGVSLAGCSSSSGGKDKSDVAIPSDAYKELTQYGFTPAKDAVPNMQCHDDSYQKALKNGLRYGLTAVKPYAYEEGGTVQGNEWDMLKAAAAYVGITKIVPKLAPFETLIPSLQADKIDLMPAHQTPERNKLIAFSAPAYWYGPVIIVQKGNPDNIKTFEDLARSGVTVGVEPGSAAQIYMHNIKGKVIVYQDANTQYASLDAGRETAVLDDGPVAAEYIKEHPGAKVEILQAPALPADKLLDLGYSYFRYGLNKKSCSLNMAISRGLEEIRANGVEAAILAKHNLDKVAAVNIPGTQGSNE